MFKNAYLSPSSKNLLFVHFPFLDAGWSWARWEGGLASQAPKKISCFSAFPAAIAHCQGQFFELGCPNCRDLEMQASRESGSFFDWFACGMRFFGDFLSFTCDSRNWLLWLPGKWESSLRLYDFQLFRLLLHGEARELSWAATGGQPACTKENRPPSPGAFASRFNGLEKRMPGGF